MKKVKSPYVPKPVKILSYKRETHDSFTIKIDFKVKHEPGQFVQLSLPGIGEAPISICSFSDKHMELNIRQVGNMTNSLSKLKVGDSLFVRGPYGKGYPMDEFIGKDIVIIGGGCGVAPLRGVIDYIETKQKSFGNVKLFLGYRTPEDILFKDKLKSWEKQFNTNVSVDKLPPGSCFSGQVGFVTEMIKADNLKANGTIVFICGPPIMIEFVIKILKDKDFKDNQIYVSAERLMHCALGVCGHCMIHGKYTCLDGPVFRWDELKDYKND